MGEKRHCDFRFQIPHLSCSVLRSPLLLSAREVISCVYVALPIEGSSLAGTAGCEARLWVGVGKDVMAAWPSIFNSSGDFFRAPCQRLNVTIIAGQSHRTHQSKPNGTLFCGGTASCRLWPAFWRSARKRP
ncbi:hypothetical protein CDEST_06835 [Colletotrichum destructivum]|uniref:Uncharacterized protein n=1 Tax=Colletotrichum destructivum TaxID=34406 RepID=A0AAX4IFS7_9PEZI|nr:hypothetical protein CDEST_06835 [Colletotrichum destructivum]